MTLKTPHDILDPIKHTSPRLAGMLKRNRLDTLEIVSAYLFAIGNGGMLELDYVRPDGQSFNPRPARVSAILMKDMHIKNRELIIAAILACADEDSLRSKAAAEFGEELVNMALEAQLACCNTLESTLQPTIIAAALWLDRARHFHLAEAVPKNAAAITEFFYKYFSAVGSPMAPLIGRYMPPLKNSQDNL